MAQYSVNLYGLEINKRFTQNVELISDLKQPILL